MFKSGYHQICILDDRKTFLGFSWVVNGLARSFCFYTLPSAPYIFTKVVRVLVEVGEVTQLGVYLDDGICCARDFARCDVASTFV